MADGQTVSAGPGLHRHLAPPSGLQEKNRLHPEAEPAFPSPFAVLLARNAMLTKALDQERAVSADMRRILLSQEQTPVSATPSATRASATLNPLNGSADGGLSAGYPDLGFRLTQRQHQILGLVLAGQPSKNIAADLGISRRTVESHRAAIMQRTGATSLPALARLAIGADVGGDCKDLARP